MRIGDVIVMMSDGVIYAGVGELMNLGWQRPNVVDHLQQAYQSDMTALGVARQLLSACDSLYMQRPGDDTTVAAVKIRKPMPVYVMVGPPVNKEDDRKVVDRLIGCPGKKVICGGHHLSRSSARSLATRSAWT